MEKVAGGEVFRKHFWVVGDFAFVELSLPWSYRGRAAGCSPCFSARVCVNLLGELAVQKVFKLVTEVVQGRTGLSAQGGLPASTGTEGPDRGRQVS